MPESLISLVVTHDVPSPVLSSILTVAYEESEKLDSPPALVLLETDTKESLHHYTTDSVSHPPITSFKSPFLGKGVEDIADFLFRNSKGSSVSSLEFLVADEKTIEDENTLLLLALSSKGKDRDEFYLTSVRIGAQFANHTAVAISVGSGGIEEIVSLVDSDGVYRGGPPRPPPMKGGAAPRNKLAG